LKSLPNAELSFSKLGELGRVLGGLDWHQKEREKERVMGDIKWLGNKIRIVTTLFLLLLLL